MSLLLALLAAVCYAVAYVLQYHEAHEAPARLFLSPRLLVALASHPLWLAGIGAMIVGNILQAFALGLGSLAVVEPALTTSLLFALPLSAAWRRERLSRHDWAGAVMVSGGLAAVLVAGHPSLGDSDLTAQAWALTTLSTWLLACILVAAARHTPGGARAAMLAAAAGTLFGLQDALTRSVADLWHSGFVQLLTSWEPWVLVVTAVYGLTLMQSSYEAGSLPNCLPALAISEPVVGALIGVIAFDEHIATDPVALFWEAAGAAVMVTGTWLLARSRLVLGAAHPDRQRDRALLP